MFHEAKIKKRNITQKRLHVMCTYVVINAFILVTVLAFEYNETQKMYKPPILIFTSGSALTRIVRCILAYEAIQRPSMLLRYTSNCPRKYKKCQEPETSSLFRRVSHFGEETERNASFMKSAEERRNKSAFITGLFPSYSSNCGLL